MKRLNIYLILVAIGVFVWLFVTSPLGYQEVYISFYSIFLSFIFYFIFSVFSKYIEITKLNNAKADYCIEIQCFIKWCKQLFPYWIFIIILFIGTLILTTNDTNNISQNIATLLFNTLIIFLTYLFTFLLNKTNVMAINNLPAFFNMLVILPLVFRNKSTIIETVFNYSIFNSLITRENRPHTILYALLLISLFIILIKYLAQKRMVKCS